MSDELAEKIDSAFMAMSKRELVDRLRAHMIFHNKHCQEADTWKKGMCALAAVLKPFADVINERERDAARAQEVGGLVPLEVEDPADGITCGMLYAAREALEDPKFPAKHVEKFNDYMRAARICIKALKFFENAGSEVAVEAMAEVRKIDPHV